MQFDNIAFQCRRYNNTSLNIGEFEGGRESCRIVYTVTALWLCILETILVFLNMLSNFMIVHSC